MNIGATGVTNPAPERALPPRRRARVITTASAVVALCLTAAIVVVVRSRSGDGSAPVALPSTSQPVEVSTSAPISTTASTAPSTTAAPTTVAVVTAPTQPPIPAPYTGPVVEESLNPSFSGGALVAEAAVPTVSAYRVPLEAPAPAAAEWTFPNVTQFGTPTVFLVDATAGPDWLRVLIPMKPNGTHAWVHRSEVTLTSNTNRLVVDIANRSVTFYSGANVVSQTSAVVGKDGTPTPTGTYYVTDLLKPENPGGAYGPYILATSARSDAFDFFNGGEPIVALHGTNQPWLIGSAASNGCVRLPNDISTQLASITPLGTPVYIV